MQKSLSKIDGQSGVFLKFLSLDFEASKEVTDINLDNRVSNLKNYVQIRNGSTTHPDEKSFPAELIIQLAADRYFELIGIELSSLCGMFTEGDMLTILNTECSPVWNYSPRHSIASMVADDNGIEELSDLEEDSEIKSLLEKLIELTPTQNAALADCCERIWRLKSINSLRDTFKSMGLSLVD